MTIDQAALSNEILERSPSLTAHTLRTISGAGFLAIIRAVSPKLAQASINELRSMAQELDGPEAAWWCKTLADCAQIKLETR
jgi:hypothetical protein